MKTVKYICVTALAAGIALFTALHSERFSILQIVAACTAAVSGICLCTAVVKKNRYAEALCDLTMVFAALFDLTLQMGSHQFEKIILPAVFVLAFLWQLFEETKQIRENN